VISRPTTDQIILDCRRELLDVVLPDVQSEHVRVSVQMLENVLRNVATRSAHEIAWMQEEAAVLEAFADEVAATLPEWSADVVAALGTLRASDRSGFHLAEVTERYSLAGEAFSCALEAAIGAGHAPLGQRAADLLAARNQRELEINGEWAMVGRT
jgi:hypothetical protein